MLHERRVSVSRAVAPATNATTKISSSMLHAVAKTGRRRDAVRLLGRRKTRVCAKGMGSACAFGTQCGTKATDEHLWGTNSPLYVSLFTRFSGEYLVAESGTGSTNWQAFTVPVVGANVTLGRSARRATAAAHV